jgi:hypothetical protein
MSRGPHVTVTGRRTCLICGEPVVLAYMPGDSEPVDVLHTINIGLHDHDAQVDLTDDDYGPETPA